MNDNLHIVINLYDDIQEGKKEKEVWTIPLALLEENEDN